RDFPTGVEHVGMRLRDSMRVRRVVGAVAAAGALITTVMPTAAVTRAAAATAPFGTQIRLARASFDPLAGLPAVPSAYTQAFDSTQLWLVELGFPTQATAQRALAATGMRFLGVVPDTTYIARGPLSAASVARSVPGVRAVVPLSPWFKVP